MAGGVIVSSEGYAQVADVQKLTSRTYGSATKPTVTEVEEFIKEEAKLIDARLRSLGFTPPLSGTSDVTILKHINALKAAILAESHTLATVQGDSPLIDRLQTQYDELKKELMDGVYTFETAGDSPTQDADGPDDLDEQGDRADAIFRNSSDQRENQF